MNDTKVTALAEKAASKWKDAKDRSNLNFHNIVRSVARGTGITNRADLKKLERDIRAKLQTFSANKRRAEAKERAESRALIQRIAP